MVTAWQSTPRATGPVAQVPLAQGAGWGALGGLAGTMAMDVALIATLSAVGLPPLGCYSLVGDTVARFFSLLGLPMAGGVPLGVIAHYVIGPVIGAIYGAALAKIGALRAGTRKRGIILAILYVEVLSQPLLIMAPLLLQMSRAGVLQWYGMSTAMHVVAGAILGLVLSHGLRLHA